MSKHPRTEAIIKGTLREFIHVRLRIMTDLAISLEEELADSNAEVSRLKKLITGYEDGMTDQQIIRTHRIQSEQDSARLQPWRGDGVEGRAVRAHG